MVEKYWELLGWSITLTFGIVIALFTEKTAIYVVCFMLSTLFLGVYLGKMIYAEDAVSHPDAFKPLTEKELSARRGKR